MDRPSASGRLVEQLHNTQARHRKVIQQLQTENARRLTDLADVRHERDTFRKEAARLRRENAELLNQLEELLSECQDLKREKATLVAGGHYQWYGRSLKMPSTLSVLNEEQPMSPETSESPNNTERISFSELETYLERNLPDPPKSDSPPHGHVVTADGRTDPGRSDSPLLPGGDNAAMPRK